MAKNFTLKLQSFGGLRYSEAQTDELALNEASEICNFTVTDAGKLQRREGFFRVFEGDAPLRGIFCGAVGEETHYLAVVGETLLSSKQGFDSMTPLTGQVPGTERVNFFPFHGNLYLLTGAGILEYDGEAILPLEPHIPTIMISTPADGSGVVFEDVNLLTKKVKQKFSPDGTSCYFAAAVREIDHIDWVRVNGVDIAEDQYNLDETQGVIELVSAPAAGVDTMEVQYQIWGEDVSDRILNCRFATAFGGASDTRAFLYGNADSPALRYHSGVVDGKPSFHHFPETAFALVGTGEPITAILRHYDRQLIFTRSAAYYSYLEYMTGSEGRLIAAFPVLPLNEERGCVAMGQACLADNTPYTAAAEGLFRWTSTNIRDERNAECISEPIDRALQREKLDQAILFNRKEHSELYLCIGSCCYVYHYRAKLFYRYDLPAILGFCQGDALYFYTAQGIYQVGGDMDDGKPISALWRSKQMDFGERGKEKKLFSVTLFGKGEAGGEVKVSLRSENATEESIKRVRFSGASDGEKLRLATPRRRFCRMEATLSTESAGAIDIFALTMKGRITDAE